MFKNWKKCWLQWYLQILGADPLHGCCADDLPSSLPGPVRWAVKSGTCEVFSCLFCGFLWVLRMDSLSLPLLWTLLGGGGLGDDNNKNPCWVGCGGNKNKPTLLPSHFFRPNGALQNYSWVWTSGGMVVSWNLVGEDGERVCFWGDEPK